MSTYHPRLPSPQAPDLLLGWTEPNRDALRSPIADDSDDHLVTIAPTGAGKGVSCAIPALLSWPGPAIVIDPKGEAFNVTARYRRSIGQQVYLLDPFGVTGHTSDSLNPLDLLLTNSDCLADDAHGLADLLCDGVRHTRDPFWDDRASALITGLILYVHNDFGKLCPPTLMHIRELVNASHADHQHLTSHLLSFDDPEYSAAAAVLQLNHNTYNGIISTAGAHVSFLRAGPVADSVRASTIPLAAIRDGEPLTLYLVLPPDKLISHGRLLRLWLGIILSTVTRRRAIPPLSTLFLVDEAAQLGHLGQLLTAVTLLRGYGVKVWTFWQDLTQLSALYPRTWQTLLNNCRTQQYFAPASPAAAEQLHEYLAGSQPRSLLDLKPHQALLSRHGSRPDIIHRANYMTDTLFRGRFDPNPYFARRRQVRSVPPPAANVIPFKRTLPMRAARPGIERS